MSRRSKLILLGAFLVLLGMLMGYVVLTWAPENPLRFTLLHPAGPRQTSDAGEAQMVEVDLAVENVSSAPVLLYTALVADSRPGVELDEVIGAILPSTERGLHIIPARSVSHLTLRLRAGEYTAQRPLQMHYGWKSALQETANKVLLRLKKHLSQENQDRLPWISPQADVTPLRVEPR